MQAEDGGDQHGDAGAGAEHPVVLLRGAPSARWSCTVTSVTAASRRARERGGVDAGRGPHQQIERLVGVEPEVALRVPCAGEDRRRGGEGADAAREADDAGAQPLISTVSPMR